jgi:hypothetical protein
MAREFGVLGFVKQIRLMLLLGNQARERYADA